MCSVVCAQVGCSILEQSVGGAKVGVRGDFGAKEIAPRPIAPVPNFQTLKLTEGVDPDTIHACHGHSPPREQRKRLRYF